jgi:hypothetical protein
VRTCKNSPFCAEDQTQLGTGDLSDAMNTHFQLFAPDSDLDPTNNHEAACPEREIDGVAPNNGSTLPIDAANYFQQWKVYCTVDSPSSDLVHPYVLKVWSDAGQGTNQFSILALHGSGSSFATPKVGLQVYAQARLPLLVAKPEGGPAELYVARVLPSAKIDRTLELDLFDLSDNPGGGTGSITIAESSDVDFGSPISCNYTIPPGNGPEGGSTDAAAPWGSPHDDPPDVATKTGGCTIDYNSNTWSGQWVTIEIPIPKEYTCQTDRLDGCWIKMKISPGVALSDATTWNAKMAGSPVRLVK